MRYLLPFFLAIVCKISLCQTSVVDSLYIDLKAHPNEDTIRLTFYLGIFLILVPNDSEYPEVVSVLDGL